MILTRTPFRLCLGGGSTDLPAYYEQYGGFIFAVTINLYMYLGVNRPPTDEMIRLHYSESENVSNIMDLKHNLARAALQRTGIVKQIEIASMADVGGGTGLGSSASYLIGLLNSLHTLKGENVSRLQLAEEAFEIATEDLGLPDGKQDFYLAAFGNFCVLDIAKDGRVSLLPAKITRATQEEFERNTLLFNTNVRRSSVDVLQEQQDDIKSNKMDKIEMKHKTKEIGKKVLDSFERGDLDSFGRLMDEHWNLKRQMSNRMSNSDFDEIYEQAKKLGVLGGKIIGAGGGGFFLVYCQDGSQSAVRELFERNNFKEVNYKVDSSGAQVLVNRSRMTNTI
jgi:D-glycero-alpha-D-manno-heptose-7-phosphate kinase